MRCPWIWRSNGYWVQCMHTIDNHGDRHEYLYEFGIISWVGVGYEQLRQAVKIVDLG